MANSSGQARTSNPILNSPFREPSRHFKFDDQGITSEVAEGRRPSTYWIPVPKPRSRGQAEFDWSEDREEGNALVDKLRREIASWRVARYPNVTYATRSLLEHWTNPERENKLFFCQIEALETVIWLTECAEKQGGGHYLDQLRASNKDANPELFRLAMKMATGSGKTVVMAMLIAWQALNKSLNRQDSRFSDAFLLVAPGITIRDRLRVLIPNDPSNYYRQRDIIPAELHGRIDEAKIVVTNYHAFIHRTLMDVSKTGRSVLQGRNAKVENDGVFQESDAQMVRRVLREFGNKKNIVVINDEAHHCYRRKQESEDEKLKGDDRKEAEERDEEARIWISGLEAIQRKIGIKSVYDLSATPFFLKGSGYKEGTPFTWIVSDFSLVDAIEAGIVKIPRVPVEDTIMAGTGPINRELWDKIRDGLPKKGRKKEEIEKGTPPKLPAVLETAIESLFNNYRKYYKRWDETREHDPDSTPPVFIVVCNNTNVSSEVYRHIAGYQRLQPDGSYVWVPGKLDLFSNVRDGHALAMPNTILVDSQQLESGEAMSAEFKQAAQYEIEEFKREYRQRFPDRDVEKLTDEDLLREVMNTVGKKGKLGEQIRCVVSVSMLTEGWDANTVSHILGVRAFGTQLLCEQVVGRGLRRRSYAVNEQGMFEPEYAEIYGVPFKFIHDEGEGGTPPQPRKTVRVKALKDREHLKISFPRVAGYKYEFPERVLSATFSKASRMVLSPKDVATWTQMTGVTGDTERHSLEYYLEQRPQKAAFHVAKLALEKYFTKRADQSPDGSMASTGPEFVQSALFPQMLRITKDWMASQLVCEGDTAPGLLLVSEFAHRASDSIYLAIAGDTERGFKKLMPRMHDYDPIGSSEYVDFDTARPVYDTKKSHVSHVVGDTKEWEQKMAQVLEESDEVIVYVKNDHMGFVIPYDFQGEEKNYYPDFIARIRWKDGSELNLIIEVSSYPEEMKSIKVETAKNFWVPAINNHGGFGCWAYVEVRDPWTFRLSEVNIL